MTTIRTRPTMSFIAQLIVAIRDRMQAAAIRRAQRLALGELLLMDAAQLDDLGLNPQDVLDALTAPPPAGPRLEARREFNATRELATATW
jgi:hypothetical protein